jgi:hypothetical protein
VHERYTLLSIFFPLKLHLDNTIRVGFIESYSLNLSKLAQLFRYVFFHRLDVLVIIYKLLIYHVLQNHNFKSFSLIIYAFVPRKLLLL